MTLTKQGDFTYVETFAVNAYLFKYFKYVNTYVCILYPPRPAVSLQYEALSRFEEVWHRIINSIEMLTLVPRSSMVALSNKFVLEWAADTL